MESSSLEVSRCDQAARKSHHESPSPESLDQMIFEDPFQPGLFSDTTINQFCKNMLY